MKTIVVFDANLPTRTIDIPAGKYKGFTFRFSGAQDGATAPTQADFGNIITTWKGAPVQRAQFVQQAELVNDKYGVQEATASAGDTQPFSYSYFIPAVDWLDEAAILDVPDKEACKIEWTAGANLAGRVSAASIVTVVGIEGEGEMSHILGLNYTDYNLNTGLSEAFRIDPFGCRSLWIEADTTNINRLSVTRNGQPFVSWNTAREVLNDSNRRNRRETAASAYAEVDLLQSRTLLEQLKNQVATVQFDMTNAAVISCFWAYIIAQPNDLLRSRLKNAQELERVKTQVSQAGGVKAVQLGEAV